MQADLSGFSESVRGDACVPENDERLMTGGKITRRAFVGLLGASATAAATRVCRAQELLPARTPILLFNCDFNWVRLPADDSHPHEIIRPSQPEDWAEVSAQEYFDWHVAFGNNALLCQAYCSAGYALYPSRLGPVGKGKAATLFPRLYALSRQAGMSIWSYFTVNADLLMAREHPEWIIPGSVERSHGHGGFFGPETPRTQLLVHRIREFLRLYPVDWLLLDWFAYGALIPNGGAVQPAAFVQGPFRRIIGRELPDRAEEITPEENLTYKRAVLAEQFAQLQAAVKETSPNTRLIFNVPYHRAQEELWVDHPMLKESDGLFAESSNEVVDWLLQVRQPAQRVMTTIIGRTDGVSDPNTWKKWYTRGCDFFGYAWGAPPSFRPLPVYEKELQITKQAFAAMSGAKCQPASGGR